MQGGGRQQGAEREQGGAAAYDHVDSPLQRTRAAAFLNLSEIFHMGQFFFWYYFSQVKTLQAWVLGVAAEEFGARQAVGSRGHRH
jgi:hypothetical protein